MNSVNERKEFYVSIGVWVLVAVCAVVLISLGGCATWIKIDETDKGIIFKSNKGFIAKYKKDGIEAEADTKNSPLIDLKLPSEFKLP